MSKEHDFRTVLNMTADLRARAKEKNPKRQMILDIRLQNLNRLLLIEKDPSDEFVKPKFSNLKLLLERIKGAIGSTEGIWERNPKPVRSSNLSFETEMFDSEKIEELLEIIDQYKLKRKPLKLDLKKYKNELKTKNKTDIYKRSFEVANYFSDSQMSALTINLKNDEKPPFLNIAQEFNLDEFSFYHQQKMQQNDAFAEMNNDLSFNRSLNHSKLNGRKKPVPKRLQVKEKNSKSDKEKADDSEQPKETVSKKDSKPTAKKHTLVTIKDSDPDFPHTKTESKKSRSRNRNPERNSSSSGSDSRDRSSQQKNAKADEILNASLVDIVLAPEYDKLNLSKKSARKEIDFIEDFQKIDFESNFRIPRTEDIILLDFLVQMKRSRLRSGSSVLKMIENFCDQYTFIVRRKFDPKDFIELMERLLREHT